MELNSKNILQTIKEAVSSEQLFLPSLPDIVTIVQHECSKPNVNAKNLADALSIDPAISVRLLQIANSSLYKYRAAADSLHLAVARLGLNLVKNLVMSLAMTQVYKASNDVLDERFKEIWRTSTKTAALCRLLASHHSKLDAELAMLAGLIHNIGALPILIYAEDNEELFNNPNKLRKIILELQGEVGAHIFKSWNFPQIIIDIARDCMDFTRKHDGPADYTDVVQVALIEGSIFTGLECPDDWSGIPAFEQLGINSSQSIYEIDENKIIIEETESLLN
ncbi:MAG: HDOD domain-containing protein [Gammaproteobacteria bacterium]|nr:HDOD domain-containing protein [Gammaproteobacteria bacterium]